MGLRGPKERDFMADLSHLHEEQLKLEAAEERRAMAKGRISHYFASIGVSRAEIRVMNAEAMMAEHRTETWGVSSDG